MTGRVFQPNGTNGDGATVTAMDQLVAAGRAELPASDLASRVCEAVAYRKMLAEARPGWLAKATHHRSRGLSLGVGAFALAAGALLWWHSTERARPFAITPEAVSHAEGHGPIASSASAIGKQVTTRAGSETPAAAAPVSDPCRTRGVAIGRQPLIDDFEDGDDEVLRLESRSGLWRWARDTDAPGSAPALLPIPRANASATNRMALHVKGGRLLDWGAIIEFNFRPGCYDASAYGGLTFQAKGPGRIFVAPREIGTIPTAEGGTCTNDCYNPHVKKVDLGRQWKTYRVEWAEFEQRGYGRPAFDPKRLHSLAFLVRPEDTPYDVWFDDVSFIQR